MAWAWRHLSKSLASHASAPHLQGNSLSGALLARLRTKPQAQTTSGRSEETPGWMARCKFCRMKRFKSLKCVPFFKCSCWLDWFIYEFMHSGICSVCLFFSVHLGIDSFRNFCIQEFDLFVCLLVCFFDFICFFSLSLYFMSCHGIAYYSLQLFVHDFMTSSFDYMSCHIISFLFTSLH